MNRAATEDVRSPVWPVISRVLRTGPAPTPRTDKMVDLLDDWVSRDAPRLDADGDGLYDESGPVILDAVWRPLAEEVMRPVLGDLVDDVNAVRGLSGQSGHSYVDKDLRTLLGEPVAGPFNNSYCGGGSLSQCRDSLWAVLRRVANQLTNELGEPNPAKWSRPAATTGFTPGLIPNRFPTTNRPTFQQVLELERHGP